MTTGNNEKMLPKSAEMLSILKGVIPQAAFSNRYETGRLCFRKIDGTEILKTLPGVIDEFWENPVNQSHRLLQDACIIIFKIIVMMTP